MANITRIKAKDSGPSQKKTEEKTKEPKKTLAVEKTKQVSKKKQKTDKGKKKPFFLLRPFIAFGRYLRDSWRELRKVRWPGRKATWKMTGAVLIYCALFLGFIVALDALFTLIFNNLLK